ncbi:MAG: prefoldin subunit [Desulfurococcaceae archaeon]
MSIESLPPEVRQKAVKYDSLRNMLLKLEAELRAAESELREVNEIMDTLKNLPENIEVYKSVGHVLIKESKDAIYKELEERKELLTIKLQKYKNQVELLRKQVSESERELKESLERHGISFEQGS